MESAETALKAALVEWQEARKAIFAFNMQPNPSPEQLALWIRLGNAEHRLMNINV